MLLYAFVRNPAGGAKDGRLITGKSVINRSLHGD
jgi:hypothetical protein